MHGRLPGILWMEFLEELKKQRQHDTHQQHRGDGKENLHIRFIDDNISGQSPQWQLPDPRPQQPHHDQGDSEKNEQALRVQYGSNIIKESKQCNLQHYGRIS